MGTTSQGSKLDRRVISVAEAVLRRQDYVTAVDVFVELGWLSPAAADRWRQGRVDYLERVVQANLSKISSTMRALRRWATDRGLRPSETAYVSRTRDRRALRFSKTGDPKIEQAYRTHWVSPALSDTKRERLAEKQSKAPDLVVIWALNEWTCSECSGTGELLIMEGDGPLCLACADLAHLVYLPSGDAALTRRAKRASRLTAVVVRFSRARRRYERQGLLVEDAALAAAEEQCLADDEARRRRRERETERRNADDVRFREAFAEEILRLFPGCSIERANAIALHTSARSSGRVGRSAAGRALDPAAVTLAVAAAVRHADTSYDELLMSGMSRADARHAVRGDVEQILDAWRPAIGT